METTQKKQVLTLAGIKDYVDEWEKRYTEGERVIFKYRRVYQLQFSPNIKGNYYLQELSYLRLPKGELPYSRRGSFYSFTFKQANRLLKREVFNT